MIPIDHVRWLALINQCNMQMMRAVPSSPRMTGICHRVIRHHLCRQQSRPERPADLRRRATAHRLAERADESHEPGVGCMYDGEGHRVEQYVSGGSGNHTYYLPGNVEEVTPSGSLIKYYSASGLAHWDLRPNLRLPFAVAPYAIRRRRRFPPHHRHAQGASKIHAACT